MIAHGGRTDTSQSPRGLILAALSPPALLVATLAIIRLDIIVTDPGYRPGGLST